MKRISVITVVVILFLSGCPNPTPNSETGNTPVSFIELTADGSATDTTTKLTLAFDKDIEGLSSADITLPAVKGELTRMEKGVYELPLTSIITSGAVTVSVAKSGYAFSPDSRTVTVYAWGDTTLTITFAQIADDAPSIAGPTLYRVSNGVPTSATLTVDNPEQYDSINWQVQNTEVTGTGPSFTLSAANAAYNLIGEHFVTVLVMVGGVPYNKTVSFNVEY